MSATSLAIWLSLSLMGIALVPTSYFLAREALRRLLTKRAIGAVAEARRFLTSPEADAEKIIEGLTRRFDALTIERAILELLRSEEAASAAWAAEIFKKSGLVATYGKRLREARKWSERAHAAEVLGIARATTAVPELVAALRDRHEDDLSVKVAAAGALAKLRDPTAIPLLAKELLDVDERSSRTVAEALTAFGVLAVPELLRALGEGSNATARVWAARILGRIRDTRATDDLVTRLYDRDDRLRMAAAEALGNLGDARALQPLVRATLRDPAPQVRAHAAGAVATIEGARAMDVLVAALADPDYGTRLRALEAFETMRIEDTSALEAALRDPNVEVRRRAALALERVGYLDKVIQNLTASDRATRERAYSSLLELGRVGLADSVASYVHHVSFEVRAIAAKACGELGVDRVVPLLVAATNDGEWPVRAAACTSLGRLRHEKAPEALVARLTDAAEVVREAAAEALTNYAGREMEPHLPLLIAAYDVGSVTVRTNMVVLATRLTDAAADDLLVRASGDPSDTVRLRAVSALGDRGGRVLVEPLVVRLTDASLEVRMAAVTGLGSATSPEAFEGLLRALGGAAPDARDRIAEALSKGARSLLFARLPDLEKSASHDVRIGLSWTLGKTGDPRAVPALSRFLRDKSAALRASAAGALAKIAVPAAVESLLSASDDPDGRVRAAVVNSLGRSGNPSDRVLRALERRATDPDGFVRNRAVVALARVSGKAAEALVRSLSADLDAAPRTVALALVATESAIALALDEVSKPGALTSISKFLSREDPAVRTGFFAALHLEDPGVDMGGSGDLVVLYEQVLRSSLEVEGRRLAVSALGRIKTTRAIELLGDAVIGDPDETVRVRAATALASVAENPIARASLVRAVSDPNSDVARAAIGAIAGIRERDVMKALARRLGAVPADLEEPLEMALANLHRDDPMPFLDWMMGIDVPDLLVPSVRVLARIAHPSTLPVIRELARSKSGALRAAAVSALGKLPGTDASDAVDQLTQDPNEEVRIAALGAMTWSSEAVLRTAALRRDPSIVVRAAAASALARASAGSAKSALRALEAMLDDASARVRAAALTSLVLLPTREGLVVFGRAWMTTALDTRLELRDEPRRKEATSMVAITLSSSSDPNERRAAVTAIGAFAIEGFQTHVLGGLRDPAPDVRLATIQALADVDDAGVRTRLQEMLSDPDPAVRDAARRSLVRSI